MSPRQVKTAGPRKLTAVQVCRRLRKQHGPIRRNRILPPLEELIATILSQNTSDVNSYAAFESLCRRFPGWDAVRRARIGSIAKAIERGGLARQKAPRIKAILQEIHRRQGRLTLDVLCTMPTDDALQYLLEFPGVGPKTAACVLLFGCEHPVLPVDTHVHRVSRRLGMIGPKTTAEQAHEELAERVPETWVLEFHLQLIRHGRTVCRARNPRCPECVLLDACPEGQGRTGDETGR